MTFSVSFFFFVNKFFSYIYIKDVSDIRDENDSFIQPEEYESKLKDENIVMVDVCFQL